MAIDYRKEVDSGFDRKRIVEYSIMEFLKNGIPASAIEEHPYFIYGHEEMLRNLERGYESKKDQILEIYGGYGNELDESVVPNTYADISHPVGGELYPMTPEEEKEKFKLRDEYVLKIAKLMRKQSKNIEKEKEKIINKIVKFKAKYPVIDKLLEISTEMDNMKENNIGNVNDYIDLFKKNGLTISNLQEYEKIYSNYNKLQEELNEVTKKYNESLNNKTNSDEIRLLVFEKDLLEKEIIQRNTKLVNGFLREKFADLLVDMDDLFQVCYIEMGNAVKVFDYKRENRFSTLAYKYMEIGVKKNFTALTGEKWENYWYYKMIRCVSGVYLSITGRMPTAEELAAHFDKPVDKMREDLKLCYGTKSYSSIIPEDEEEEELYENGDYEFKDDGEIFDESVSLDGQFIIGNADLNLDDIFVREKVREVLGSLTTREALVITLRYGFDDGNPKTLEECAKIFGVTRERIRQIEAKSLRKLRHPLRSKLLKDFYESDTYDYSGRVI